MRVCCVVTPQGLGLWVAGIQSGAEFFGYFVSTPVRCFGGDCAVVGASRFGGFSGAKRLSIMSVQVSGFCDSFFFAILLLLVLVMVFLGGVRT